MVNFITSWSEHTIPGRRGGIPNVLASQGGHPSQLNPAVIPSTNQAITLHHGRLSEEHTFGKDPLQGPHLQNLREHDFYLKYPNMQTIFNDILHGNGTVFRQAIKYFIQLTQSFGQLVQHPCKVCMYIYISCIVDNSACSSCDCILECELFIITY